MKKSGIKQPLGIILAGGQARRMGGGDKALLPLGNSTLLGHVINRLEPQVGDLALNANGDQTRFQTFGLPVLADSIDGFVGPLAGVLAGLDWAAETGASHVVSAAADTPFLPPDLVPQLLLKAEQTGAPIVLSASDDPTEGVRRQPTFGLWPVALREDLRDALNSGLRKIVIWTQQHNAALATFPTAAYNPFFNVNTPEDLIRAEAMLKGAKS